MSPPSHVQAVCALTNVIFITAGLRDLLSPGSPLPMPNDDRLMLLWGNTITKKHGVVAAPVDGAMLFLAQCWGMLLITVALAKIMTVFSNMHEGTYLRRNLFISFGLCNCGLAYLFNKHNPFLKATYGADASPFVALFAIEGLVLLHDAIFRPRRTK